MISLETLLILNVLGVVSLLYSVTTLEGYPIRLFLQIISSGIFTYTGILLMMVVTPIVGILYLSLAMLVASIAFTDYLNTMQISAELREEEA